MNKPNLGSIFNNFLMFNGANENIIADCLMQLETCWICDSVDRSNKENLTHCNTFDLLSNPVQFSSECFIPSRLPQYRELKNKCEPQHSIPEAVIAGYWLHGFDVFHQSDIVLGVNPSTLETYKKNGECEFTPNKTSNEIEAPAILSGSSCRVHAVTCGFISLRESLSLIAVWSETSVQPRRSAQSAQRV